MSYLDEQLGAAPVAGAGLVQPAPAQLDRIEAMLQQSLEQQALLLALLSDDDDEEVGDDVVRGLNGNVLGTARDQGAPL